MPQPKFCQSVHVLSPIVQQCSVNGRLSTASQITYGVAQGSLLGPSRFRLFRNEKRLFLDSETSASDEKTRVLPTDRSRTYDLLITSPDSVALLLSFRRPTGAKGH